MNNVLAAVKEISKKYRVPEKAYIEAALYVGGFEIEVEEYGNKDLVQLFVSPSQERQLHRALNWANIRIVASRRSGYKKLVKVEVDEGQKLKLQWIIETADMKVVLKEDGIRIKMRSNPNLRNTQKAMAYKPRKPLKYQKVHLQKNEVVDTSIESMDNGYWSRHFPGLQIGQNHLWQNNTGRLVDNSTLSFLSVKYDLRDNLPLCAIARSMCKRLYLAKSHYFTNGFAFGFEATEENMKVVRWFGQHDKETGKDHFSFINEVENGIKKGKILVYEPMFQSPSMTRQSTMLYMNVTNVSVEEIEFRLNEISAGAYFILKEAYQDKELPADKAIKLLSRMSLLMTGSAHFGNWESFAIFYGELSTKIHGKSLFNDGHGLLAVQFIMRVMAELGHPITEEEAYQYANQGRCGTIKGFNTVADRSDFDEIMQYLIEEGIATGIVVLKRTRENAIRVQQNENGEFDNKIIVFGDPNYIDYFGDQTTLKCMFDISKPLEYCLMDMPVKPKGHVLTSKQICNVLQFHKRSDEILKRLALKTAENIIDANDDTDEGLEMDQEGLVIKTDVLTQSDYAINSICQMLPNAIDLDPQIRKTIFRGRINSLNKSYNRFNFRVKGGNYKVIGDLGGYFGIQLLLSPNEMFVKGKRHNTNKAFDAAAFRHPLVGRGEHGCVSFVAEEIMMQRIDALLISDARKEILKRWIHNMNPGVAMVASAYPFTVAYYSGMDFDGDMVTLIEEDDVLEIVAELPQTYNEFGKGEAAKETFKFGREALPKAFLYQFSISDNEEESIVMNPAIGELAGFNVSLLGLANSLMRNDVSAKLAEKAYK